MKSFFRGKAGLKWIIYGCLALVTFAFTWSSFPREGFGKHGKRSACMSNMKQISVSLLLYSEDSEGKLPQNGWWPELKSYGRYEDMLECPSFDRRQHVHYGYAMNRALRGMLPKRIEQPERVILMFETDASGMNVLADPSTRNVDRHQGYANVSYADGHVRSLANGTAP